MLYIRSKGSLVIFTDISPKTRFLDVDLKKAAKLFANKFACGSSVTKNNQGNDEIVVQGDVSDEIFDLILEHWPIVSLLCPFFVFVFCLMRSADRDFSVEMITNKSGLLPTNE